MRSNTQANGTAARNALGGMCALGLAAALALSLVPGGAEGEAAKGKKKKKRPNIILVVTDDQTAASMTPAVMPRTHKRLVRRGTAFSEAIVTTPLCCPARATIISGQYGHNNGVLANSPGWPALAERKNTLPNWLRRAGYRTAHVGKWLHRYGEETEKRKAVAPGWDDWHTFLKLEYYDYKLRVNGKSKRYRSKPKHHLTRVLNQTAKRLIKRQVPRRKPFFLELDHLAPHRGTGGKGACTRSAVPEPRDRKRFRKATLPRTGSFNEADVSDKPSYASERESLSSSQIAEMQRHYRCALASLRGVDRGIGKILRALKKAGERRNTAVIFTSDNGFFAGEHRMLRGKVLPYEEALRVPLVVSLPRSATKGRGQDRLVAEPVANVDIAPTILDLARAKPCRKRDCRTLDGRSLVDLARGESGNWPAARALAVEFDKDGGTAATPGDTCAYVGVRTPERLYVDHTALPDPSDGFACKPSTFEELYRLDADPFQLDNLAVTDPGGTASERATLRTRLDRLRDCAGISGRDPAPPSGHFCE